MVVTQLRLKTKEAADQKLALKRKEHFQTFSDMAWMLMAVYKDFWQIGQDSLQGCINPKFRPQYHSRHFNEVESTESLLDIDMSKTAVEVAKVNMLTNT